MARADGLFRSEALGGGLDLHLLRTKTFKTVAARLVLHADLDAGTAARALVPRVLQRGTRSFPDMRSLQSELDRRFGAGLSGNTGKMGERHLVEFSVDWLADKIAGRGLLVEMFDLLAEMLHEPATDPQGALREDYVLQERKVQADEAAAIFDDKGRYARHRLIEAMCKSEPYARPAIGRAQEILALDAAQVRRAHRRLIDRAPADLFIVGDVTWSQALRGARRLGLHSRSVPARLKRTRRGRAGRVRTVRERQPVGQGKLALGFRTSVRLSHRLAPALAFMNALYGGTATGKLFKVVRERESLCYSIASRIEWTKGLLVVQAGIEPEKYAQARRLILRQLADLGAGRVSKDEMFYARQAIQHGLRSLVDSPRGLIEFALQRAVNGAPADLEGLKRSIDAVTVKDVTRAARTVKLDTVFFLTDEERR